MIRILVAEDSPVQRELLLFVLESDGAFQILDVAHDGAEAVEKTARLMPDLVLMDYHMPSLNGGEATQKIMENTPTPIVITSASLEPDDLAPAFEATRLGALAVVRKPTDPTSPDFDKMASELTRTLKLMSEVKVVRRRQRVQDESAGPVQPAKGASVSILGVAASTGGPSTVAQVLTLLKKPLPVPIMIVQHMTEGFLTGFATWLSDRAGIRVRIAVDGEVPQAGYAYLAPDGFHMGVDRRRRIHLRGDMPENGFRPSADVLLRSLSEHYRGEAMGVILTGMGADGVEGLRRIREAGGLTVAQNEESCVVYGMPREAVRRNAAEFVLSPPDIALLINERVRRGAAGGK